MVVEPVYENVVEQVRAGTWKNGSFWYGMETGVVDIAPTPAMVPQNVRDLTEAAKADIKSGKLVVFTGPSKIRKALSASPRAWFLPTRNCSAWIGSLKASSARSTRERVLKRRSPGMAGFPFMRQAEAFLSSLPFIPAAGRFHPAVPHECGGEATARHCLRPSAPAPRAGSPMPPRRLDRQP